MNADEFMEDIVDSYRKRGDLRIMRHEQKLLHHPKIEILVSRNKQGDTVTWMIMRFKLMTVLVEVSISEADGFMPYQFLFHFRYRAGWLEQRTNSITNQRSG